MSVDLTFDGAVARIVLNRPEKLNALDTAMIADLAARCAEVERSAARVVILSGQGKAFCAGGARASELAKMMINVAEGEERERIVEALAGSLAAGSDELAEGLAAFREKRAPDFGERIDKGSKE